MVEDLLRALGEFKTKMEYRNAKIEPAPVYTDSSGLARFMSYRAETHHSKPARQTRPVRLRQMCDQFLQLITIADCRRHERKPTILHIGD